VLLKLKNKMLLEQDRKRLAVKKTMVSISKQSSHAEILKTLKAVAAI